MSKRVHEPDTNGVSKKLKSHASASLAPSSGAPLSAEELIKQKRAEIAAKMAAMTAKRPLPSGGRTTPPPPTISAPTPTQPTPAATEELARRVAEAKRRVADAQTRMSVKDNPYLSLAQASKKKVSVAEPTPQGAGLKMAAHPLLLDTTTPAPQSKKDRYKPMQPKFASIKANVRNTPAATPPPVTPSPIPTPLSTENQANPYSAGASTTLEGAAPRERGPRQFKFVQKGKYVQIANQIRQEAQLEQLKHRIAESARKAGLDAEFESVEKSIKREPPPAAEWWDAALLPNKTYEDLERGMDALNIRNDKSPITLYVQHPIPIPGPGEKDDAAQLKPLVLTKKERKKMRKQRRQAELQDKRDRIRMGLIPPDPPKVRLANLMKVLTSDAVQDPTRVEARVRREVAMRRHNHEKMNIERKLTDEQRREKTEAKKLEEERKGLVAAIFKIKTLSDPAHRFKVRKNAEQLNLTGLCIFHPSFNMVYVEGAAKLLRQYKRLMLHRIHWKEAARARGEGEVELQQDGEGESSTPAPATSFPNHDTEGEYGSGLLEDNECWLVWEGTIRERGFTAFRARSCPTDVVAREALGSKMSSFWDQTKNWRPEEEELF